MPKSAIFVVSNQQFRDEELAVPKKILEQRGVKVRIAAQVAGQAISSKGMSAQVDVLVSAIDAASADAVVFVGGQGSIGSLEDSGLIGLAQDFYRGGKIVAAICHATAILANAGLLIGKRATGNLDEEQLLLQRGAEYTGLQAEIDGRVVTGKDSSAATEFGEALCQALEV